jgi:hypothetical protein
MTPALIKHEAAIRFVAAIVIFAMMQVVSSEWYFMNSIIPVQGKLDTIKVGSPALEQSGLIYIAQYKAILPKTT